MNAPANPNTVWNLIQDLSSKKGITEIIINDPKRVFVERGGQLIQLNIQLRKNDLYEFAKDIANFNKRPFGPSNPILDGNLPDGSRINIIAEPYAHASPAITIRKYLRFIKSFDETPGIFGLDQKWVDFFKAAVHARINIIISGGTGVGKTTFMNLLLNEIATGERVITIEDTLELSINVPNVVRLEAKRNISGEEGLNARDLVKNTLRMRPDRIIIGEVRGGELFDLLQAMNTGHDGSMSSIHANSPSECISRMENLFLMAGYDVPHQVVKGMISSGVDFIIQLGRDREGNRQVQQVMELTGMEGPVLTSQQLAVRDDKGLRSTGITPAVMEQLHLDGGLPKDFFGSLP